MNIIYRVYEKCEHKDYFDKQDTILNQEVCICDSREHFKAIMKSLYGDKVAFRNSKNLPVGTPYIVIISENCYNTERYINVMDYTCGHCNKHFKALQSTVIKFDNRQLQSLSDICSKLYLSHANEIENMVFCCPTCREQKFNELKDQFTKYIQINNIVPDIWVDKDIFSSEYNKGYIYKITKKSTGEFYVGQTRYNPIFRWGQHLTTNRFNVKNIDDYIFEVLEIVNNNPTVLRVREAYWIENERQKCPEKSLNIQNPDEEKWEEKLDDSIEINLSEK